MDEIAPSNAPNPPRSEYPQQQFVDTVAAELLETPTANLLAHRLGSPVAHGRREAGEHLALPARLIAFRGLNVYPRKSNWQLG